MWEVLGYQITSNPDGAVTGIKLYCSRPFKGERGTGSETKDFYYRPSIEYRPSVGDRIFISMSEFATRDGKFIAVDDIIVVGG